eukprot:jgi/Ulvmu1/8692/UM047_0032.1
MNYVRCHISTASQRSWAILCISLSPLLTLALLYILGGPPGQTLQASHNPQAPRLFATLRERQTDKASIRSLHRLKSGSAGRRHGKRSTRRSAVATTSPTVSPLKRTKGEADGSAKQPDAPSVDNAVLSIDSKTAASSGSGDVETAENQAIVQGPATPDDRYQGYPFKIHPPGSLSYVNHTQCPGVLDGLPEDLPAVGSHLNFLLILGAQKAGTTWLFDALDTHPRFNGAQHGYRRPAQDPWRKEVHFFDSWPIGTTEEYLSCFSEELRQQALHGAPHVLVDATPAYLYTPAAAARVRRVVPHAKFVIVLRDPTERIFSQWKMMRRMFCPDADTNGTSSPCNVPSLQTIANATLVDGHSPPECSLYAIEGTHSWGNCWRCSYAIIDRHACERLGVSPEACRSLSGVHPAFLSYYAAQIAWWLSFFPPERFLIITSQQLHDPKQQVQVLNRIRHHVGLNESVPFTADQISNITGFRGGHSMEPAPEDAASVAAMRSAFDAAEPHLQRLMDTYFPDQGFTGFGRAPV